MKLTQSGHLIQRALLPFSLICRASYNSHEKISAATLNSYLPFEQTAIMKFEKDTRFNDTISKLYLLLLKISLQYIISKGEDCSSLQNTKPKSLRCGRKELVKGVRRTVWKRMKYCTWGRTSKTNHTSSVTV